MKIFLPLAIVWLISFPLYAVTINVNNAAEFRSALSLAAENGSDNTIILNSGTYKTSDDGEGTFKYTSNTGGSLTLKALPDTLAILDGDEQNKIIRIYPVEKKIDLHIINLTFQNGNSESESGGAISFVRSFPLANFTIEGSTFRNNISSGSGGAIYYWGDNDSILSVKDSRFESNIGSEGGAISTHAINVERSVFLNNQSTVEQNNWGQVGGGALSLGSNYARSSITESRFEANSAKALGGAINWRTSNIGNIQGNVFLGNSANRGGAIGSSNCLTTYIIYNQFSGNTSKKGGAALHMSSCPYLYISSNVFTNNVSVSDNGESSDWSAGGIHANQSGYGCCGNKFFLTNNLLLASPVNFGWMEEIPRVSNNVFLDNEIDIAIPNQDFVLYLRNNYIDEARLPPMVKFSSGNIFSGVNLAFVDRDTSDFRLSASSDLIDAGTSNQSYATISDVDISGSPRILGNSIDIGPYEYVPPPTLTFIYAGDINKPIVGITLTQTQSDNTVKTLTTNANGKLTLPANTDNSYTLSASFTASGEDPISLIDAIWILQHAGELRTLTADQLKAADVSGDGEVDVLDAVWILQHLGELRTIDTSLVFLDAVTGEALSETTFSPTDTPNITVIRMGDVDQSYDPTTINAAGLNAESSLITSKSKTDTADLIGTDFNIEDTNEPPYLDLWATESEGTVNVGRTTIKVSTEEKETASFRFIHLNEVSSLTLTYAGDNTKVIGGVKLIQMESDGTKSTFATNNNGQVTLNTTTNTYTLSASLAETGEDPVDLLDAIWILQYSGELRTLTADQLKAADVSGDGVVDILDAIWILQHSGELRTLNPSLVFLDANTGNALSETIFNPGDTPSIRVIRMGDVDGSYKPPVWVQIGEDIIGEEDHPDGAARVFVSINEDGSKVAIGDPQNSGDIFTLPGGCNCVNSRLYDSGHVRIFDWNGSSWVQLGSDIQGEAKEDFMTYDRNNLSINKNGNVVAIGAERNDSGNGSISYNSGHVRIFAWEGSDWVQRGADIDGNNRNDYAGQVSIDDEGDTVAVGARGDDSNASNSGLVRIFDWDGSGWVQRGSNIYGEVTGDYSGQSLSISGTGDTVAIGSGNNSDNGNMAGHTRVFAWDGSDWAQKGEDIDGEEAGDISGWLTHISKDGNTVIAVSHEKVQAGSNVNGFFRVFAWDGNNWVKRGSNFELKRCDSFLESIGNNANTVAILQADDQGSKCKDYNLFLRTYDWDGSDWVQRGGDIKDITDGPANRDDGKIAISGDGNVIAIVDLHAEVNGQNTGSVRIYKWE